VGEEGDLEKAELQEEVGVTLLEAVACLVEEEEVEVHFCPLEFFGLHTGHFA